MGLDPALPASLAAELNDLKRRIRNLESSPRLTNASITGRLRLYDELGRRRVELGDRVTVYDEDGVARGAIGEFAGSTAFYDAAGVEVARFGSVPTSGGGSAVGARVIVGDFAGIHIDADRGLIAPYEHIALHRPEPEQVTASTFEAGCMGTVETVQADTARVSFSLTVDAGVNCTVRARLGPATSSEVGVGPGTWYCQLTWEHGLDLFYGPYAAYVEARRDVGTGSVYVWPGQLTFGDFAGSGTATGAWSVT